MNEQYSPHHDWNDEDFDWIALDRAGKYIADHCRKYRIGIHWKEKYGTLRYSFFLFDGTLHQLIWPGYVFHQNKWIPAIDRKISWIFDGLFGNTIRRFQLYRLSKIVDSACRKWPHIRLEILDDFQFELYRWS